MRPDKEALLDRMERNQYFVPSDFPRSALDLQGMPPKFSAIAFEARYYLPGCTPPMLYERWESMEDFAQDAKYQLLAYDSKRLPGKTRTEILEMYYEEFAPLATKPSEELRWVIRRAAHLLNCEPPECAAASYMLSTPRKFPSNPRLLLMSYLDLNFGCLR